MDGRRCSKVFLFFFCLIFQYSEAQECDPFHTETSYDLIFDKTQISYRIDKRIVGGSQVNDGMHLDTTCGRFAFFVPIQPINSFLNTAIPEDSTFFKFTGFFMEKDYSFQLFDFPYADQIGMHFARVWGLFGIGNPPKEYRSIVSIETTDNSMKVDFLIPINLIEFGADTSNYDLKSLKEDFKVQIVGKIRLNSE